MVVAARRDVKLIPLRKAEDFLAQGVGELGVVALDALEPEADQLLDAALHVPACDQLGAVAEGRVSENGDAVSLEDRGDRLLGADIIAVEARLVDILPDRDLLRDRVAVAHHEVADMGLAGIFQRQEALDLRLGESEAELRAQKVEPEPRLLKTAAVTAVDQRAHLFGVGAVIEAEDMVLPLFVLTGKLHARNELRIVRRQSAADNLAPQHRVVIGHGKKPDPLSAHLTDDLLGRIGAVGDGRMHM